MAFMDSAPGEAVKGRERAVEVAPPVTSGSYAWILQRISAVLLIVFLGVHWWISHYATVGESITFERVGARLMDPILVFVDAGMLAIVIYHGLNGLRNVILDFNIGKGAERTLAIVFIIIGIIAFVYGLNALLPFTTGTALFYR